MASEQSTFNQRRALTKTYKYINSCVRLTQLASNICIIFKFICNYVPIMNLVNIFQRMTIKCNTRKSMRNNLHPISRHKINTHSFVRNQEQ